MNDFDIKARCMKKRFEHINTIYVFEFIGCYIVRIYSKYRNDTNNIFGTIDLMYDTINVWIEDTVCDMDICLNVREINEMYDFCKSLLKEE